MIFVFLLYALFASVFTLSKTGLEYTQPFFLVGSRMLLAGVLLLGYVLLFQRHKLRFNQKQFLRMACLALFNIYLTNTLEFWGLQYLTSSKTCFIYSLSPFVSALIGSFILTEKISSLKWVGMLIGFAGMLPILLIQTTAEERAGEFFCFSWAELAVMGAAICSCYGWIILKQLVYEDGLSPLVANGFSMLMGGAMALAHSYAVETWNPLPVTEYIPFLECAFTLIVVSNLICYNLYGWLLKRFSATFMSFAGLSTPLFAALFGWVFLGEVMAWPFYVSLAVVASGLYCFYQEEFVTAKAAAS